MVFSSKGEKCGYSRETHINFVNHKKVSPLHLAVQSGDLDMIQMCLDNGAHVDMIEASVQPVWLLTWEFPSSVSQMFGGSFILR